jgi:hypothetical protein
MNQGLSGCVLAGIKRTAGSHPVSTQPDNPQIYRFLKPIIKAIKNPLALMNQRV